MCESKMNISKALSGAAEVMFFHPILLRFNLILQEFILVETMQTIRIVREAVSTIHKSHIIRQIYDFFQVQILWVLLQKSSRNHRVSP